MTFHRAFTLLELLMAVMLLGMMSVISIVTYRSVVNGWRVSREYMDRLERTDFALDQLVSGLRCTYYPHNGEQSYEYGFQLEDRGDGENPRDSDIITWTKKGPALIGASASADALHRIELRVLEKGDSTWGARIEQTGLYARVKPMATVMKMNTILRMKSFIVLCLSPRMLTASTVRFNRQCRKTGETKRKKMPPPLKISSMRRTLFPIKFS